MSLYNISNFSATTNPVDWIKTGNTLSGGVLGIGLPIVLWLIIFITLSSKGLSKYAFITASFLTGTISLPLVIMGLCSWVLLFVFVIFTAIGSAILIYDKGY